MPGLRHANIGLAVGFLIMLVGAFVLRDASVGAQQALGMFGFLSVLVVYVGLEERENRQRRRRDQ